MAMARIFISYRRVDSQAYVGRLYDRLSKRFGRKNVFMDIDTINPGADFGDVIEKAVSSCDALLVVIGEQWLRITDDSGQRRLDNPRDYVRLEITTALERDIRVIPVLVGGASMPSFSDLPEPLNRLARLNALQIGPHFHPDVNRLLVSLGTT